MRNYPLRSFTFLFLFLFLFSVGAAEAQLIDGSDPEAILEIAKGYGSANLKEDSYGDPVIVGMTNGTRYSILFYGCTKGKNCSSIQFLALWKKMKIPLKNINKWNEERRFARTFIDKDGDLQLAMDVNLDYGVSQAHLNNCFDWWKTLLGAFEKDVIN